MRAIEGNAGFALDESDLRDDATGYTADLLPLLKKKYPKATFTFIIGADSLANSTWERFDEVLEQLERFVIAPRIGVRPEALQRVIAAVPKGLRERIATLNMPELTESAYAGAHVALAGTQRTLSRTRGGMAVHRRAQALRHRALVVRPRACSRSPACGAGHSEQPDNAHVCALYASGASDVEVVAQGTVLAVLGTRNGPSGDHEGFLLKLTQQCDLDAARRDQRRYHRARAAARGRDGHRQGAIRRRRRPAA